MNKSKLFLNYTYLVIIETLLYTIKDGFHFYTNLFDFSCCTFTHLATKNYILYMYMYAVAIN